MKTNKNSKNIFKICLLLLGIGIIFSLGINTTAAANISNIYVNGSSGNDNWNGLNSTWTSGINGPKATIKNATGTLTSDGTVYIASGTYNESNIQINKNMTIIGESQKNTIIDGQQSGNSIFNITSGLNVTIINLTLTNGMTGSTGNGAAIDSSGNLTVDNCTFTNNSATNGGGGAIIEFGGLTVNNSTFTNNTSMGGGAILVYGTSANVNNSTFTNNSATIHGGAIYSTSGLIVYNSTFTNNSATNDGGAIYNFVPGTLIVKDSNFTNNTANEGGAIYTNNQAITTIVNFNRFIRNTASSGNAIYDSVGTVNATDNWWGSNNSPAGEISGQNVEYNPWIVLTINKTHEIINVGGTSTITADLLHDSNGVYHDPANGHVPDGITINFSNDAYGTVTPLSAITTNGIASTTYTGSAQGTSNISATLDEQTLKTNIKINKAPVNPIHERNINPINTKQKSNPTTLNATTNTIPMQHTGVPVAGLILAILTVIVESITPKIKK